MRKSNLPPEVIRERLSYDPLTGVITWRYCDKVSKKANRLAGKPAGCIYGNGNSRYWEIRVSNHLYNAHILAFICMTGEAPPPGMEIDHIDGDGLNNRWSNLRLCNKSQNQANSRLRRTNTSGFKGVCWHGQHKRWMARIHHKGRQIHLGLYDTPEAAHEAYCSRARVLFGEFARPA